MASIHEVQEKVLQFFFKEFGKEPEALHFIKLSKNEAGWEAKVEVTEENGYLKKLGHPSIFDKNVYAVHLDGALDIVGYALAYSKERSYTTEEREEL
jgi:hypothetical protein